MITLKRLFLLSLFPLFLSLSACGGGGGGSTPVPQAQKVTATLALNGNAATAVGAVDVVVVLPDGFVLEVDNTGQPLVTALSGLVSGSIFAAEYIPETTATNGEITAGIIKAAGFPGNAPLIQISRTYAAGTILPTANDFIVTVVAYDPIDAAALPGISAQMNISTQPVP